MIEITPNGVRINEMSLHSFPLTTFNWCIPLQPGQSARLHLRPERHQGVAVQVSWTGRSALRQVGGRGRSGGGEAGASAGRSHLWIHGYPETVR